MKRSLVVVALVALCAGSVPAQAAMIGSYSAYIGMADLYNSNGVRLTTPWQVIRQDRANFHRYGIQDDWDEWDPLFDNANNRARMESILSRKYFSPGNRRLIVNGDIFITVNVYGQGSRINDVEVIVP